MHFIHQRINQSIKFLNRVFQNQRPSQSVCINVFIYENWVFREFVKRIFLENLRKNLYFLKDFCLHLRVHLLYMIQIFFAIKGLLKSLSMLLKLLGIVILQVSEMSSIRRSYKIKLTHFASFVANASLLLIRSQVL